MTDSRCANPAYAEDVDTMMIEYTAYNAIVIQLKLLRALSGTRYPYSNDALVSVLEPAKEAAQISEIYEVLINLFRKNHGTNKLSEAARLDGTLLKFLTLLNMWARCQINDPQGQLFNIAPDMQAALRRDRIVNQFLRQRWLRTRADSNINVGPKARVDTPVQARLPRVQPKDHSLPDLLHFQEHLVPYFMHVSQRMLPEEAELSEIWMLLASRMMIQAAIEIIDAPDLLSSGIADARLSIEQCFAWGYVPRNRYGSDSPLRKRLLAEIQGTAPELAENITDCQIIVNDALNREDDCVEMFFEGPTHEDRMDVDNLQAYRELSDWTKIRQEALDTVLAIFDAMVNEVDEDKAAPIRWLKDEYQLSALLGDIAKFLEVQWNTYRSPEWHGKPILVQIEQGGIQGMSDEEFRSFKQRAGIV